jgi:hypothetical protein
VKKHVQLEAGCEITINDPDVIERVTGPKGDEWRSYAYNLHTEEDVLGHLAYNCLLSGAERVNQLDGWADLPGDAATMQRAMNSVDVLYVNTLEPTGGKER